MKKVLIIRRDNIGDLVCTTPLFSALREALPLLEESVAKGEKTLPPDHPRLKEYRDTLAACRAAIQPKVIAGPMVMPAPAYLPPLTLPRSVPTA